MIAMKNQNFSRGLVSLLDEEEFEHRTLDINVRDIYRIMYNRARFQQISTVVVDYHMPGMDGIEFCRSIKNPNIQKILLTSIVDESKAIECLNDGLINTFIRKQSPNIMQQLGQALVQAQNRYFSHLSQIVQQVISVSPAESALSDPAFIELFHRLVRKFDVVEYYLTEFWAATFSWTQMAITLGFSRASRISWNFTANQKKRKMHHEK